MSCCLSGPASWGFSSDSGCRPHRRPGRPSLASPGPNPTLPVASQAKAPSSSLSEPELHSLKFSLSPECKCRRQATVCDSPGPGSPEHTRYVYDCITVTDHTLEGLPWWVSSKEPAYSTEDAGLTPGSRRSPGGGLGNPFQDSCLENPMDRGAWWAAVHRIKKSWTQLK